jgi:hypothetical protein
MRDGSFGCHRGVALEAVALLKRLELNSLKLEAIALPKKLKAACASGAKAPTILKEGEKKNEKRHTCLLFSFI